MDLKTPLRYTSGIGPALAQKLDRLNLKTVEDLIHHYPFRYEDYTQNKNLNEAKVGETVTVQGELWDIKNIYTKTRKLLTQATLNDGTGTIELIWFHQPWLIKNLKTGDRLQVSGKINRKGNKISLIAPVWEKITSPSHTPCGNTCGNTSTIHTGRLIPVYPETYGLTSKWLRAKINQLLPVISKTLEDPLPENIRESMLTLNEALSKIHFPESYKDILQARKRLAFDELFYIQLSTLKKRADWQNKEVTQALKIDEKKIKSFVEKLPFKLTDAQNRVIREIIEDVKATHPANRLIQGEVGSGKTVVAAVIIYLAHLNNLKSILMTPTEILAFQHHSTLQKLLEPFGIRVGIYTGSKKFTKQNNVIASTAKQSNSEITAGRSLDPRNDNAFSPDVIVGTHALLSEKLEFENIGLVVIDEQQRFGVGQRSLLRKQAKSPHFLTMTATPIPRTVALTLYGDLDLSVIDEMPKGRMEVRTHFVPNSKRADSYQFMAKLVHEDQQIYIITPLIEISETLLSAKAAKVEFERLQTKIFPKFKLGLLHGKLKSKEKEKVINKFKNQEIDILVSTSVVEVGMDIPNATVMVIEGAERFGLAQLHQLRGRVGRGNQQSFCFLFAEQEIPPIISRLRNLEKIHNGLALSELDLKIRGSGEIFGTRQSGDFDLKIASLSDLETIEQSRQAAINLLQDNPSLDKYPQLLGKLLSLAEIMPD